MHFKATNDKKEKKTEKKVTYVVVCVSHGMVVWAVRSVQVLGRAEVVLQVINQ